VIPAGEADADADGFRGCGGDCDDTRASVNPNGTEVCNGLDDDCDGSVDEGVTARYYRDSDSDGYGLASSFQDACSQPTGYVVSSTDCNDTLASVNPVPSKSATRSTTTATR